MKSRIAQKSRDDKILKGDAGRRMGGRLWSNCVSRQGGIRDGKRGMCAPFRRGWMLQTVLLSQLYLPRAIALCREQNFYALWYLLCTVVFVMHCGISCELVVFSVDCWLAGSKEQSVLECVF